MSAKPSDEYTTASSPFCRVASSSFDVLVNDECEALLLRYRVVVVDDMLTRTRTRTLTRRTCWDVVDADDSAPTGIPIRRFRAASSRRSSPRPPVTLWLRDTNEFGRQTRDANETG